jgi:5-(carboxyamino)imidazole ribonucleotide synthase
MTEPRAESAPTRATVRAAMGLPVVGMVGGGQLSRMTHQAAIALGLSLRVLADATHDSAALVASGVVLGDHTSLDDVRDFARGCEVTTFDHEHVPGPLIEALEDEGLQVWPGSVALRYAQDKIAMRERLAGMGVPVPAFTPIATARDLEGFAHHYGWPLVLKSATGGYDGKGVWVVGSAEEAAELLSSGVRLLAEELVPLRRELAAVVARSPYGQAAAWPVVETAQAGGICVEVVAPAPGLSEERALEAQCLALRLADELGVVGVLAVELFESSADSHPPLLVNELAMRPHNSAHWTIEGARTSQFEQHLRAVLDYPLGATTLTAPWVAMANLLGGDAISGDNSPELDHRLHLLFARDPALKVHLYGKQVKPGRKIGHVTALGDDLDDVRRRARAGAAFLRDGTWLE